MEHFGRNRISRSRTQGPTRPESVTVECRKQRGVPSSTRVGYKFCEVLQAVEPRHDDSHGVEARPDHEIVDVVEIHTKLCEVRAFHPSHRVRSLDAALVCCVEGAEVVSEQKSVRNVQVVLARGPREGIVPPRVLNEGGVYESRTQLRGETGDGGLVANEGVVPAAGCA